MTPEFRAWDKRDKKLRPVAVMNFSQWFLAAGELCEMSVSGFEASDRHNFEDNSDRCNRFVLEQYTGLKDKNGNKIFEGDILKSDAGHTRPFYYLVEYSEEYAAFVVDHLFLGGVSGVDLEPYEVAGNIHENPELLEVDE